MAEESVDIQKLEKVVDVSTQLANVSRRMSQGSYTMGLVLEYNKLLAELPNLKLLDNEVIVRTSDTTRVSDYNQIEVSRLGIIVVRNSQLRTVEIKDPSVACIKTHTFQGSEGLFSIVISGGKISDINFTPKDGQ